MRQFVAGTSALWLAVAIATAGVTSGAHAASSNSSPSVLAGTLTAAPSKVQPGTMPTLMWAISYPHPAKEVASIDNHGTIAPKRSLYMDVRVLGASVQTSSTNWLTVEADPWADGASNFSNFFSGRQPNANPTKIYSTKYVRTPRPIDFRGRCCDSGWYPYYVTGTSTANVVVLVNGGTPPDTSQPAFDLQDLVLLVAFRK